MDTYIDNGSATTDFGTEVSLRIGEGNGSTNDLNRSLIKFDLSSIPANATITSATLSLWTSPLRQRPDDPRLSFEGAIQ